MKNKKAYFDYEIVEEYIAGMALLGSEVKSLREGHGSLNGSYCYVSDKGVMVKGMNIKEYANACTQHEPLRERQLLLTKKEIAKINRKMEIKGMTLIPLNVIVGNTIKLKIGIAKGKKKYDKRESIKAKDIERDTQRRIKY